MGQFHAGDRDGRGRERLEAGHRRTALLDGAVVLLDEVIEVFARSLLRVMPARTLMSQQPQRTALDT